MHGWAMRVAVGAAVGLLVAGCTWRVQSPEAPAGARQPTGMPCDGAAASGGDGWLTGAHPACSNGPRDTLKPFPVSRADAIAAAERIAGEAPYDISQERDDPKPLYVLEAAHGFAIVDGVSGELVEFSVLGATLDPQELMPEWSPEPSVTPRPAADAAAAVEVARAWLAQHAIATKVTEATATRDALPGADVWEVALVSADGRAIEVRVAPTGMVLGFRIADPPLVLALPRLERDAALGLAVTKSNARYGRTNEQISAAQPIVGYGPDGVSVQWIVSTGVPSRDVTSGETTWFDAYRWTIDAMTGEITEG